MALRIDVIEPGFAGHLGRMRPERRNPVLAVLASQGKPLLGEGRYAIEHAPFVSGEVLALRPVAKDIRRMSSRELLLKYFGVVPDGLLGALGKIDTRAGPQPPGFFIRLIEVFSERLHRRTARLVRNLPHIDAQRLAVIEALDPVFQVPRFVAQVESVDQAHGLNQFLALIRSRRPDLMEGVIASVRASDKKEIQNWVRRWALELPLPKPVISGLPDSFRPLSSGCALREVALRYRNCLSDFEVFIKCFVGRKMYFEIENHGVLAEVEFFGTARNAILAGIYGVENDHVSGVLRTKIENTFLNAGVATRYWQPTSQEGDLIRRLTTPNDTTGLDVFLDDF